MNSTRSTPSVTTITPADLAKVARRHSHIPQDALPVDIAENRPEAADESSGAKSPKSVKWKRCPFHTPSPKKPLTGLIQVDAKTLAFRDHTKTVGKHVVPCPGSGLVWVDEVDA